MTADPELAALIADALKTRWSVDPAVQAEWLADALDGKVVMRSSYDARALLRGAAVDRIAELLDEARAVLRGERDDH